MRRILIFSWFCLIAGGFFVDSANAQAVDRARMIDVNGTAEISIQPDYVSWNLTIVDRNVDPLEAKKSNDARLDGIIELADDLDLKAEDVQAGTISIRRIFEQDERGRSTGVFKHYSLRREVVLVLRDLDEMDDMLKALAELGIEFSIEFGSSKLIETRAEARLQAVAAARDKAAAMAGVLGQSIGVPINISQSQPFMIRDALSNSAGFDPAIARGRALSPGAIKVSTTVYITFELIDE